MSINEIINAYIRMSMLLFASRHLVLSPLPLHGQPRSPLTRFQESWPVLSGLQQEFRVVKTPWHFLQRGLSIGKTAAVTRLTEHFCVFKQGQGGTAVGQVGTAGRLFDYLEQIGLTAVAFLNHPVLALLSNLQINGRIKTTEITEEDYLFVH